MGTMLQEAGLDDGGAAELWNVERPDVVVGILDQYAVGGLPAPHHQHVRRQPAAAGDARPRGPRGRAERGGGRAWPATVADAHPGTYVARRRRPVRRPDGAHGHAHARGRRRAVLRADRRPRRRRCRRHPDRDHERPAEVEAAVTAARPSPRAARRRDDELRHQPPHDDGRHAGAGRRRPSAPWVPTSSAPTAAAASDEMRVDRGPDGRQPPRGHPADHAVERRPARPHRGRVPLHRDPRRDGRLRQEMRDAGIDVVGACCGSSPAHIAAISAAIA